jgi:hypothetical protein
VAVEGVEEDEETIFAEEEDVEISAPRGGAAGAAPTLTPSTTVGRKTVTTTNGHEAAIRIVKTAMNAEKLDTSGEIVQSDEMRAEMETGVEMEMQIQVEVAVDSMAMEPVLEMETDSTAKAKAWNRSRKQKWILQARP